MSGVRCFFATHPTPCDGQLIRGHLLPRQLLRREYPYGAVLDTDGWRPLKRNEDRYDLRYRSLRELIDDPRSWVAMCGGINGSSGHHGALDVARTLRIAREDLPAEFVRYCDELGLLWYVERNYPASRMAA